MPSRQPWLPAVAALAIATLACATLGEPTPPPYDWASVPPATTLPTEPATDSPKDATALPATDTAEPVAEATATTAVEGPATNVERTWEERSSSNSFTDPITYTLEVNVPLLRAPDPNDAPTAGFNAVVQDAVDEMTTAFVDDLRQYPPDPAFSAGTTSFFLINATHFALTQRLVSLRLEVGGYVAGAAHPYSFSRTINYDLQEERELDLADLFLPGEDYLNPIADYSRTELEKTDFFAGFETGADPTPENYRNWNWATEPPSLVISFDPYQVGPYAAGPQEIVIPIQNLSGLLDPAGPVGEFVN